MRRVPVFAHPGLPKLQTALTPWAVASGLLLTLCLGPAAAQTAQTAQTAQAAPVRPSAASVAAAQPASAAASAAPAKPVPVLVQAPHYGDTLFSFFQDHHFDALAGLLASQHFGRIAPHDEQAELLRGGMMLSWGLHREAAGVFERLLTETSVPAVRDRAWLQLAKIRFQRGLAAEAEQALERVGTALAPAEHEERALLQARFLMARADHAGAVDVLRALPAQASAFARYNLGVAYIKAGDLAQGMVLLDELSGMITQDEELLALRDRANVTLGYAALQAKLPADARKYLQRVRLVGPDSGKALLAYGWAALEQGEPKHALVPWGELLARPVSDPAAVEAQIAVPFALAEIGAAGMAMDRYNVALVAFDEERHALDESIAAIRSGRLLSSLLERNPESGLGWAGGVEQFPSMPYAGHLAPVLALHEFQESFKNLQDIVFLGQNLSQWQNKLEVYADLLANRSRLLAQYLPAASAAQAAARITELQERRSALAEQITKAEAAGDAAAYGGVHEQQWRARLAAAQAEWDAATNPAPGSAAAAAASATAASSTGASAGATATAASPALANTSAGPSATVITNAADSDLMRERLRRLNGALLWQQQEEFPARRWEARKALKGLEQDIEASRQREAALRAAKGGAAARLVALEQRLQGLTGRISALLPRVASLRAEQGAQLQEITIAELLIQRDRLDAYAAQARLGIAQVLDRAQITENLPVGASPEGRR